MAKKYIDAEKLRAEIDRLLKVNTPYESEGYRFGLLDLRSFLDSLQQEQPEVDLKNEYQEFCKDYPFPWSSQYVNREYIDELCLSVASHFYELARQKYEK